MKCCIPTVALETETSKKKKKIKNLAEFLCSVCCMLLSNCFLLLIFLLCESDFLSLSVSFAHFPLPGACHS